MSDQHVVCSQCGGVNRIPPAKPALSAKCGRCGARLFEGKPKDVAAEVFERQIARSTVPVLVDVWATWCGPCKAMAPAYEAAATELEPDVRLIKLSSDEEQQIAARRGIPTMILYRGGRDVARQSGAMPAGRIVEWTRQAVAGGGHGS